MGTIQNSRQQSGNSSFLKSASKAASSLPCSQLHFDVLTHVTYFCFFFPLELTKLARAALFSLLFAALKNAGKASLLQRPECQRQQWAEDLEPVVLHVASQSPNSKMLKAGTRGILTVPQSSFTLLQTGFAPAQTFNPGAGSLLWWIQRMPPMSR